MSRGSPAGSFLRGCLVAAAALVSFSAVAARAADLVASSYEDGNVYRISAGGTKTVLASGLGQPHEVEVDRAGNVYVAEVDGDRLTKISPGGTRTVLYTFPSPFDNPEGLARAADGSLFAVGTIGSPEIDIPNQVARISPAGVATTFATVGGQENLSADFDRAGNLYISELANGGSLWRVTPGGVATEVTTGIGFATGVAVRPDGQNVLVSSWLQDRIYSVAPDGTASVFATIGRPWALAFDPNGSLFVAHATEITRIDTDGTQHLVATGLSGVRGLAVVPEPAVALALATSVPALLLGRPRR